MQESLTIAGISIEPGENKRIELPAIRLYIGADMSIPVYVARGKKPGPTLFVSAAIHGDELNGVEIISRLINKRILRTLQGTLIAIPIVNGYGVLHHSRYLPDRRDLNRSFPGSKRGSLAGRVAHLFLKEIVSKCQYGIDLHTGALHRSNLAQIRANLEDEETRSMAKAFGVPVLLNANLRDGSLRACCQRLGVKVLLYEAGQALRFDELSIRAGVRGIINVMYHLNMLRKKSSKKIPIEPFVAKNSGWIRATDSGFVVHHKKLGDYVKKSEVIAEIKDPYGGIHEKVLSNADGIIIGKQNIPLVQEGEAMYHIAYFSKPSHVVEHLEKLHKKLGTKVLHDDH